MSIYFDQQMAGQASAMSAQSQANSSLYRRFEAEAAAPTPTPPSKARLWADAKDELDAASKAFEAAKARLDKAVMAEDRARTEAGL